MLLIFVINLLPIAAVVFYLHRTGSGVSREDTTLLKISEAEALGEVMEVLRRGHLTYRYVNTVVGTDGRSIDTRIRPLLWPLFLSTALRIELECRDGATQISVATRSQKIIRGDVFHFYDRYIQNFLGAVRARS